jgi:hypothetical protein
MKGGKSMFCDKCGADIGSGAQFCSSCGKAVVATSSAPQASAAGTGAAADGRVQRHIQILASLWLASGILRLVEVCWIFIAGQMLPFLVGWGMPGHTGDWPFNFLPFGLYSIGGVLAIFGLAHLVLAWGLFQREPWARVLGLVLGILALLRPPFGTALGIYTLWVLWPQHSGQEYERLSRAY